MRAHRMIDDRGLRLEFLQPSVSAANDEFLYGLPCPLPHRGSLNGLMLGVQKSRPVRLALLNALASVAITVATSVMRSSSNAAPIKIGCGKDVE